MSNNTPRVQHASTPIMAAATTTPTNPWPASNSPPQLPLPAAAGNTATRLQLRHQQQQQQLRVVSPVVSPVPQRQPIATILLSPPQPSLPRFQYVNGNLSPLPHYLLPAAIAPNHNPNHQHPAAHGQVPVYSPTMVWQQQQSPQPLLPSQPPPQPNVAQQQQVRLQLQLQLQTMPRPSRDDNGDDVSSVPWGSIRPDPRYDPVRDPLNPINLPKPFVPPLEITVTIVRGRRRKTMDNRPSPSPPQQPQSRVVVAKEEHYEYRQQTTTQAAEWLQLQLPPLSTTQTGSDGIPVLGPSHSFPMDISYTDPDSKKKNLNNNNSYSGGDRDDDDSESQTDGRLQEQFSDLATYTAYLTSDQDEEEYLELRGDLLELQKLQQLQHPPYYDGIEVKPGDAESEGPNNNNNNNTLMEVVIDTTQPQPQQRKGMVRREFGRRVLRFKKKRTNSGTMNNNNNNNEDRNNESPTPDTGGNPHNDTGVETEDSAVNPGKKMMEKAMHYSPFVTHYYHRSRVMTMVSGQENGC